MSLVSISSSWVVQLEWPQEVVGNLEIGSTSGDFVDDIFNTVNSEFSQLLFNDSVVGERNSSSINSDESSLVDELSDGGN